MDAAVPSAHCPASSRVTEMGCFEVHAGLLLLAAPPDVYPGAPPGLGEIGTDADPQRLAMATLASLEGGLLMSKALQDEAPLAIALDAALDHLGTFASNKLPARQSI